MMCCVSWILAVQRLLGRVDADGNQEVDIREFLNYISEHEKKLWLTFKDLDKNNDGEYGLVLRQFPGM